jgi:adenylate cyclase
MSGVEMQANALANLIQGNWLVRSSSQFDLWLVSLAGICIGIGLSVLRPAGGILAAFALAAGFAAAGVASVHYGRFWFPWPVAAFLQLPVALVWGVAANLYVERHFRIKLSEEQRAIREAFSKYLSPQMLDRLTREGFTIDPGGEKIQAAMMFTDLENFTNMCERIGDPQRIVDTMNHYFERTTSSIFAHDGVVIKFIGDAIFAAWGAPIHEPEAAAKAARAAWDLFENDKLVVEGDVLRTRIGLHFGEVLAGNIGSTRRVDYTLIGDAVNIAARLESANKILGTHILMSESVVLRIDNSLRRRRVGAFRLKGRKEAVMVYELLGPALQDSEPEWLTTYHDALARLENGDIAGSMDGFARVIKLREGPADGPAAFFLEQIRSGVIGEGGVVALLEK